MERYIEVSFFLKEREHKAFSDVLHHELDCAKLLYNEGIEDETLREEYEARISALEWAVQNVDKMG